MEGTRASLAEKLDTLENQVLGTVHQATEAVANTVEDVKSAVGSVTGTVQETVESVKEAFNLSEHVRRHPWLSLGGAVATGFLGGYLLGPSRSREERPQEWAEQWAELSPPQHAPSAPSFAPQAPPAREESEGGILQTVKALAIGTVMNLVRDFVAESLPENLKPDVLQLINDVTTRLGGKPLPGREEAASGNGHPSASGPEESAPARRGRHNGHHRDKAQEAAGETGTAQGESQEPGVKPDRRRSPPRRR